MPPVPDFFFGSAPNRLPNDSPVEVKAGSGTLRAITITPNGAEGPVSIRASGYPIGIAFSILPETTHTGDDSFKVCLDVSASPDTKDGVYHGTVTATVGSFDSLAKLLSVYVLPSPPDPISTMPVPDLFFESVPSRFARNSPVEVTAGSRASRVITIKPNGAEGQLRICAAGYPKGIVFSAMPVTARASDEAFNVCLDVSASLDTKDDVYEGFITARPHCRPRWFR